MKRRDRLFDFLELPQVHIVHHRVLVKWRVTGQQGTAKMNPNLDFGFFITRVSQAFIHPANELAERLFVSVGRQRELLVYPFAQ